LERGGPLAATQALGMAHKLGGIDVSVQAPDGTWRPAGTFDEAGPIAGDRQVVPFDASGLSAPLRVRLQMAKGLWRIDEVALVGTSAASATRVLEPVRVRRAGRADARALSALRGEGARLVTQRGDAYTIEFELPPDAERLEAFVESRGYYYEWMRPEWLRERNPELAALALARPEEALRRLAPLFKAYEPSADQAFWSSRFRRR
jgi:hypothetical protein